MKDEQEGDWGLDIEGRGWETWRETRRDRSDLMEDILYTEAQRVNYWTLRFVFIVSGVCRYGVLCR